MGGCAGLALLIASLSDQAYHNQYSIFDMGIINPSLFPNRDHFVE